MSLVKDHETATTAAVAHHLVSRLREWWQRGSELRSLDADELARLGKDLGMTGDQLMDLAAYGPDAAHLLHERMRALGLTRADVERIAPELMRDMERTCSCCHDKGVCEKDLAVRPDNPAWKGYCPNATALTDIKDHLPQ